MPDRVDFWKIPHEPIAPEIVVYVITGLASLLLLFRLYRRASLWWRVGQHEARWDKPLVRLGRLFRYGVVQTRLLRQRYPGLMHVALAWGFFVFLLGTMLATIDSHFFEFLKDEAYLAYKFVLDAFTVIFLVGAAMAAYRRFVQKPKRLTLEPRFAVSLALIVIIVLGGLVTESLRLAHDQPHFAEWMPAGWALAQLWLATGAAPDTLVTWHLWAWAFHLLTVAALFVVLPAGTLMHVVTGPLNAFFSAVDKPMGRLAPQRQAADGKPVFVSTLRDLTWKQLLDADACTECGRCQDACPAHAAGTPLNPKQVMVSMGAALRRDGPALAGNGTEPPQLVGGDIADEVLWACTSCGACVAECPVLIDHVGTIVDMRRHLIIEGRVDAELQEALDNLGRYGNSFGQSDRARAKWTQGIDPKIKDARKEAVDYLWFVGDYASYSPSLTEISRKTAEVMTAAGLDFGIMYEAERNAGNDVRRVGEEGLFEMLVEDNQAALSRCRYNKVVTTDPHTYNTLKHEYPSNGGGTMGALHYSELLDELIASGKIALNKKLGYVVTYHDPCYLGRYNGIYDAPRRVIRATGCRLVEMPRHHENSLCCGAGGGRIWMHEGEVTERPSESRIREAAALEGAHVFVVACPKDVTMYQDAVKTTDNAERIVVKDLVELVHEAMSL